MGKIPSYLSPPNDPDRLTDLALYEWSCLGLHLDDVHRWACDGEEEPDGITERVAYLLDVTELLELHPAVMEWRSVALMTVNCIRGGGVPYDPRRRF